MTVISMDDEFYVCISAWRDCIWENALLWCETVLGPRGTQWTLEKHPEDLIFVFRTERNAAHFSNVWNRDPLILPYRVWEEFCQSPLSCARLHSYWRRVGWVPEAVFFCNLYGGPMYDGETVTGGRRHYRPSHKLYFFEFETDALIHWIGRYGEGYH